MNYYNHYKLFFIWTNYKNQNIEFLLIIISHGKLIFQMYMYISMIT